MEIFWCLWLKMFVIYLLSSFSSCWQQEIFKKTLPGMYTRLATCKLKLFGGHTLRYLVRTLIKVLKMRGSCKNSHQACGWQMLTILRLLCLIVSKHGTANAFRVMNDIDSLEMVTPLRMKYFRTGRKSTNLSVLQ